MESTGGRSAIRMRPVGKRPRHGDESSVRSGANGDADFFRAQARFRIGFGE